MTREPRDAPQFYLTSPAPCPYLPGRAERKVFTHLIGLRAPALNDTLTQSGFRRSQTIAYRPACEHCRACVSVRVKIEEFVPSRTQRRGMRCNADIVGEARPARATPEQYALFRRYVATRHSDGGMADMSMVDYQMMIEDSHVDTRLIEYRVLPDAQDGNADRLIACCLTDRLADGLSMVYSFYEPQLEDRSLGTFMILDHMRRARVAGLKNLYLGYWVEGSRKMAYKARFLPQERLGTDGWVRVD
ncbi:arginyltransferase [Methylocystis sp. MJC1]|uniref:arginyltransferase n=1 Tax=Methylocystis sp. MJC1 TaxID=2654282 RepID=UPI0013EBBD97|nr:arginyltransferase [Methylocystis sp. MJC1]KAF2990591.1 putative arginyl-tRNA--protein transferase [Methylocystis sp. MJC1]MBU6525748.1 arginyltransferase [Methylocystis sp. MJC1]UZX12217.1 arginyltransferase [Methylocystis sp. MJC1]